MSFSILAVFLDCIVDCDVLVEQKLTIERLNGGISSFEAVKRNKSKSLGLAAGRISCDFGQTNNTTESREGLVQQALIDCGVKTANEEVGANVDLLAVIGSFVNSDGFAVELETIHDFACVVSILLSLKFSECIPLVRLSDAIFRKVKIDEGTSLDHKFPNDGVGSTIIDVADIAGGILIAVELRRT